MGRRRTKMTEKKISEWAAAGRGAGTGASYQPWLDVHAFSSDGLAVRLKSRISGRTCHLLSQLESFGFLEAEWEDSAVDVLEQFPLDRKHTRRIAGEMGIRYPSPDGVDMVMSTDIVVDLSGNRRVALSFKYAAELEKLRTIDLLEIERRYWAEQGIPWFLVTECEVDEARCLKLQWLHEWFWLDGLDPPSVGTWEELCQLVLREFAQVQTPDMSGFIGMLKDVHGLVEGEAINAIRHLAARKALGIDLSGPFSAMGPSSQIWIVDDPSLSTERRFAA